MTIILILIKGKDFKKQALMISLMNAKQLVIGNVSGFGWILHVAVTTPLSLRFNEGAFITLLTTKESL